jgi:hypothetical protein
MQRSRRAVILAAGFVAAVIACTDGSETYDFVTDCIEDFSNDAGCEAGGLPYTCSSGSLPTDSDPTLICQGGSGVSNGDITFCCASSTAAPSSCNTDQTVPCQSDEVGYTCAGADSPSNTDPALICDAQPQSGANAYCCFTQSDATSTSCTLESDAGCTSGGPIAYVCPSGTTPDTIDPTLNCGSPTVLSGGFASYCCSK